MNYKSNYKEKNKFPNNNRTELIGYFKNRKIGKT